MTYERYRTIFVVFTILAIVTFIVAAILFVTLKIHKVVGDLTGINAKKAIENIRNQNVESADRVELSGQSGRVAITDKITPSGNLIRRNAGSDGSGIITTKISTQKLLEENTGSYYMPGGNETMILDQAALNETVVLSDFAGGSNETTILSDIPQSVGETTLLNEMLPENAYTEMLSPEMSPSYVQQSVFEIEFEITYIHTNESIA